MKNKTIVAILGFFVCFQFVYGQEQSYSSYYLTNGTSINPAFAGVSKFPVVSLNVRQQWVGFKGAPSTQTISYENYSQQLSSGYGVVIVNDILGASRQQELNANYSYKLFLDKVEILFGINAGMAFLGQNYSEIKLDNSYDAEFVRKDSRLYPNVGSGFLVRTQNSFFGFSVPSLVNGSRLYNNKIGLPIRQRAYHMYASHSHKYAEGKFVRPNVYVRLNENNSVDASFNVMNYFNKEIGAGVSYHTLKSIAFLVDYKVIDNLNVLYACEISTGKISCYQFGSHELTVKYMFDKGTRYKVVNPRYF